MDMPLSIFVFFFSVVESIFLIHEPSCYLSVEHSKNGVFCIMLQYLALKEHPKREIHDTKIM